MKNIKVGDIYRVIELYGKRIELKYGFYEEFERESEFGEPIPIYPDFLKNPLYTVEGYPFVTQMQDICEHADSLVRFDACCVDCLHYQHGDDLIGVCKCENRKRDVAKAFIDSQPQSVRSEEIL